MEWDNIELKKVGLQFTSQPIDDIAGVVGREFASIRPAIRTGARIAVAVGSRGIADIDKIVAAVIKNIQQCGGQPFIVPAMGSHGGATAEGQKEILAGYGVTEEKMGAPIKSSMEVVQVQAPGELPLPVYMDRFAHEADGVIVVNRVKLHTDFHGANESGLVKMLVIGLGKHAQAIATHRHMVAGLKMLIPQVAKAVIGTGKLSAASVSWKTAMISLRSSKSCQRRNWSLPTRRCCCSRRR